MQGQVSVVTITQEVFNDDHKMDRTRVSQGDSCALLKLISPPGETAGQQYKPLSVTDRKNLHTVYGKPALIYSSFHSNNH